MKVLLISNMYPNEEFPSYGIFVKKSSDVLEEYNIDVSKIVLTKSKGSLNKIIKYILFYLRIIFSLLIKSYDIIYVHYASHTAFPILFCKFFKKNIRVYTNVHGSDVVPQTRFQSYLQPLVKQILKKSDKVIVPSSFFKELVNKKYDLQNEIVIYPSGGIDSSIFFPSESNFNKFNLNPHFQYIGYVGRIEYGKGWDDLIEAYSLIVKNKEFINVKLLIVGSGKEYLQLKSKIKDKNLTEYVYHFDSLSHSELCKMYNLMSVFIFPTKLQESLGLVGLEAMSCGIPVIGSDIGGISTYLKDMENGILTKPGDINSLRSSIIRYFRLSHNKKVFMKEKAIETAANFEKQNVRMILIKAFI
ncbi:glycosyltransferase [Arthrobacter citreus]|nr:glycosyltransferase [Arthrobacter citreus]